MTRRCRCGARTCRTRSWPWPTRPACDSSLTTAPFPRTATRLCSCRTAAVAEQFDVAIVGGGPGGAPPGVGLARRGFGVVLLERPEKPRWRACGVFASPLVRRKLTDLG